MLHPNVSPHYQRHIRNLLLGLFLLAFAYFLGFARDFLLPIVLAFFIAITFRPSIRKLAHHHIPEWLSATGFISILVIGGFGFAYLVSGPLAAFVQNAPEYEVTFANKLRGLESSARALISLAEKIQDAAKPVANLAVQEVIVKDGPPLAYIGQITGYSINLIATVLLTLITALFLMASGDLFYAKLVRVLPTLSDKKTALRIIYDVEHEVSTYLLIVTGINAGLGFIVAGSFHLLGMPNPYLWGIVIFALNYIPYIGPIAGIGFATFMAIVSFDSMAYATLVPLSYMLCNGIESNFISPYFLGRKLELNSVAIILALAFWTWIWGFAGTMIAVPILVTIKVFCEHIEGMVGIGEFLSEKYPEDQNLPAVKGLHNIMEP